MTTKEICLALPTIAYTIKLGGIEIRKVENGIDDYIYCISGAWGSNPSYHKVKIKYSQKGAYFEVRGSRVYLDECIRQNIGGV